MVFEAGRRGDWWIEGWGEADRTIQYQVRHGSAFVMWDEFAAAGGDAQLVVLVGGQSASPDR